MERCGGLMVSGAYLLNPAVYLGSEHHRHHVVNELGVGLQPLAEAPGVLLDLGPKRVPESCQNQQHHNGYDHRRPERTSPFLLARIAMTSDCKRVGGGGSVNGWVSMQRTSCKQFGFLIFLTFLTFLIYKILFIDNLF